MYYAWYAIDEWRGLLLRACNDNIFFCSFFLLLNIVNFQWWIKCHWRESCVNFCALHERWACLLCSKCILFLGKSITEPLKRYTKCKVESLVGPVTYGESIDIHWLKRQVEEWKNRNQNRMEHWLRSDFSTLKLPTTTTTKKYTRICHRSVRSFLLVVVLFLSVVVVDCCWLCYCLLVEKEV